MGLVGHSGSCCFLRLTLAGGPQKGGNVRGRRPPFRANFPWKTRQRKNMAPLKFHFAIYVYICINMDICIYAYI